MARFIRGNEIVCSGTFTPVAGTAQPELAEAVLVYTDPAGDPATSTITLTKDANNVWSGTWDSNLSGCGTVEWVIRCSNGVQAATQGIFTIIANAANLEGP
jgi:hypothetical protein